MHISNIISLDSLAGVEILYKDFVAQSSQEIKNSTFLTSNTINPFIENAIVPYSKIYSYKKIGPFRLPKSPTIRGLNFSYTLNSIDSQLLLNWNQLRIDASIPPHAKYVYYEHSGIWYNHNEKEAEKIFKRANSIIAISHAAKRIIELKYGLELSKKITTCLNPLPISRMSKESNFPKEKLILGFSGRFMPVKAPWIVLHTLKSLREQGYEAEAILMGSGDLLESMKELSRKLGIEKHCLFTGSVSDPTDYYKKIKYLLIPSYCEPFGLVALEAINYGCIPIYNQVDGVGEVMREHSEFLSTSPTLNLENLDLGGTLVSGIREIYDPVNDNLTIPKTPSPEDIVKKIILIESLPSLFQNISSSLQSKIRKEHDFSTYVNNMTSIFRRVLSSP